jgi:Tfp pilus assembly protein PilX
MKIDNVFRAKNDASERGAALVTVILISLLLLTAAVGMISAVGASSKNNTDSLSEAKAYWAAESGLQAAIKVLRHDGVTYAQAHSSGDLSPWLGAGPIFIDSEASYSLQVSDPDNAGVSTTYQITAAFQQADGTYAPIRVFGTEPNTTTISYENVPTTTVNHPQASTPFGRFQIQNEGTGATISEFRFRIDYRMTAPRPGVRSFRGRITTARAVIFDSYEYNLMGSTIDLCGNASCSPIGAFSMSLPIPDTTPQYSSIIYGKLEPIQPYRLLVRSTGMFAGGARKQLEALMQRNFFNDVSASSAITLIGPGAGMVFQPGTSQRMDILGGSVPSVGVLDQTGLNTVNSAHTNGTMNPPPAVLGAEIPDWQQSPEALHNLVMQLRQTALNSGRLFTSGQDPDSWGSFSAGTGITFCDGSCTLSGNTEGGGILVVTGTLTTSGNPKFKGLILAVGPYVDSSDPGGIIRNGGGNEVFIGNVVIAPYNPDNLAAGFGPPRYQNNGAPSDTIYSDIALDSAFGGTSAITNFMLGIAEK